MIAGIIGDVIGSIYEAHQWQVKDLDLIQSGDFDKALIKPFFENSKWMRKEQSWTDDTLCTLALYHSYTNKLSPIDSMVYFCSKYKNESIGFGKSFEKWISSPTPYASYANGSIMRIGFIPYLDLSLDDKLKLGQEYTGISHNHSDSFQAVSSFILLSEKIKSGGDYRKILTDFLKYYKFEKNVLDLHNEFNFEMNAMKTLLQACVVVLESDSFEDVLRNTFFVGGDSDTLACVACNLSSYIFSPPEYLKSYSFESLKPFDDLFDIAKGFEKDLAV